MLFVQVLDGSKFLNQRTRKKLQAQLIASRIRELLPLMKSGVSDYQLFFVCSENGEVGFASVAEAVSAAVDSISASN